MKERVGLCLVAVLTFGCKHKKQAAGTGQPPAAPHDAAAAPKTPPPAAATPPWDQHSAIALKCGDDPLRAAPAKPATPPAGERTLAHGTPITVCQHQPSVAAACTCLARSLATWGGKTGMSPPATCKPTEHETPGAALVEVDSVPADADDTAPGAAYVLVARRGTTWSAVAVVESAPDVDLTETPDAVHEATIASFATHPRADGTLLWIQSQNQYSETDMGDQDVNGQASVTVCVMPTAAAQPASCDAPIPVGVWDYTFTIAKAGKPDACNIREASLYQVDLRSTGELTVALTHGTDKAKAAGHYRL